MTSSSLDHIRRLRQVPDFGTWLSTTNVPCYFQNSGGRILGLRLTRTGPVRALDHLTELIDLEYLSVAQLGIADAGPLAQLPRLRWIDLSRNSIQDISFCLSLEHLEYLNVSLNHITRLPNMIGEKHPTLRLGWSDQFDGKGLVLQGNPTLVHPPLEVVRKGDAAIRAYLTANDRAGPLTAERSRLVVLGPSSSGKSTLVSALHRSTGPNYPLDQVMSPRVRVVEVSGGADVEASLVIYRDTELLPVLLVLPAGSEDDDAAQVLRTIEAVVPQAQVVVITTRIAGDRVPGRLNGPHLMDRFPLVTDFMEANLSRANDAGLEQVSHHVASMVSTTPGFTVTITDEWRSTVDTIEARRTPAALVTDLIDRSTDDASELVDFLRRIGAIIHCDPFALDNFAVVHPEWLLGWINDPPLQLHKDHRPIPSHKVASSLRAAVEASWPELVQDTQVRYLIDLLVHLGLVVRLPGDRVIVPHALPVTPPERARVTLDASTTTCVLTATSDEAKVGTAPVGSAEADRHIMRASVHRGLAALHHDNGDTHHWRQGAVVTAPGGDDVVVRATDVNVLVDAKAERDASYIAHGLVAVSPGLTWTVEATAAALDPDVRHHRPICFVSYARPDLDAAVEFVRQLTQLGVDVAWDRGGELQDRSARFGPAIQNNIARADLLVVLLSNLSASSKWVAEEVAFAEDQEVDVAYVALPGLDHRRLPIGMRTVNRLQGWDETVLTSAAVARVLRVLHGTS